MHEVVESRAGALKRVVAARDDAGGDLEERLAAQVRRQPLSAVDAAAVQVALAAFEQAHALGEGHGAKGEADAGAGWGEFEGALDEAGRLDRVTVHTAVESALETYLFGARTWSGIMPRARVVRRAPEYHEKSIKITR